MFFLYDNIYLDHDTGNYHPENPKRLSSILEAVSKMGEYKKFSKLSGKIAATEDISLVHDRNYIKNAELECMQGFSELSTGDTSICTNSYTVALNAIGGILSGIDLVFEGKEKTGFCAVRPPGHHATVNRGMGFCIFNNIAIAARYAQKKHGVEKILIIDWDVHHGNGTQDIFYNDNTVYFMSTHQFPFYPGSGDFSETGIGKGKGYTRNIPLQAGTGNKKIIEIFKNEFFNIAERFKPDLTLISAGFDSRVDDPLGGFLIDDDGFKELTKISMEISNISGKGRLVSILEGGYNPIGLASAVVAHISELNKAV